MNTRVSPGRVVGMIFTVGVLRIFRQPRVFDTDIVDVSLLPAPPVVMPGAVLRLYEIKTARVLEGECSPVESSCWVAAHGTDKCTGEYVREDPSVTTATQSANQANGLAVGGASGGLVGGLFGVHNQAASNTTSTANTTKAVIVLRCGDENIIDCTMVSDPSALRGHGDCTDTKGRVYRLTLLPK